MTEKSKPWWRDPRFIIPGVLIPVALALLPLFIPEKISKNVVVSLDIDDPRRADPFLDMHIEEGFNVEKQSIEDIAGALSKKIIAQVNSRFSLNPDKREKMPVSVYQEDDGSLYLNEHDARKVALNLTRFPEINDFRDFLDAEYPNMRIQMTLEESILPPVDRLEKKRQNEELVHGVDMLTGIYRVVLTSPGYHDEFRYLSLTRDGELFMSDIFADAKKAVFPIPMTLRPRLSKKGKLTVSIMPFSPCSTVTTHKTLIENIETMIQSAMERDLSKNDLSVFVLEPETKVGFHPYRLKNMDPPHNHRFTDFLVKGSCRWEK